MKLFLPILFSLLLLSSANATEQIEENYSQGYEAYKKGDFTSSYTFFKKIYLQKLSDIQFNFYLGRSAYETGNYETALAAFERVSIADSANIPNKLETARTYFMLKMYEDAELMYREVLDNPNVPQNIKTNIELSLAKVSKVQKKSFTYATVMADFLYDSNINYGSLGSYEFGGATLGKIDSISDTALQLYANVSNIYDIGYKNGFAVKNTFSVYLKDYTDYNAYNVLFLSYSPSLLYKVTQFTAELVAGFDTMELGKEKYLSSASLMPRFEFNHSPTLKSIVYAKYQRKKFQQEAQYDLDANRYELSYALQNILTPRSFLQGSITGIKEKKIRGTNLYVDFDELKASLSYANQFSKTYSLDFFAQARSRDYKDYSTGFASVRNDIGGMGSAGISMNIGKKARIKLSTSYEYVNSNQDRFSYKKSITSLGFNKAF